MNTTFDVLVIVLSVLLALFLSLAIASAIAIFKVVKAVQRIVAKAEQMVDSAEAAAILFKRAAEPVSTIRALTNIIESITKHKKKGD